MALVFLGNSSVSVRFVRVDFCQKESGLMYGYDLVCVHFFPPSFFPKTPNEMGKGFSFDIFQEKGCSFLENHTMTDEWIIFGQHFFFLDFVVLKNVKQNRR